MALGKVLGLFGLLHWLKGLPGVRTKRGVWARMRILGSPSVDEKCRLRGRGKSHASKKKRNASFVLFGVPYAMLQLIRVLTECVCLQQEAATNTHYLTLARSISQDRCTPSRRLALKENQIAEITRGLVSRKIAKLRPRREVEGLLRMGRTQEGHGG